ncbi:MAG TPA: urea ABC transporter ATP-binding subunit UrtE [Microbacterium sp.]|jgi:urea transport system ATP-binding protein|uniref:urea ABC transporter ATP-binding subunit UrtE n=1 Tax=unclassified Microbacterium TaxID=2609290 RepID=UPI000C408A17|nr:MULTISPECIES: urea ABC transporter ATP-binding subunit UrtE [unclassified Microbacterium]MBU21112.1 urea ABC transporter ATP-binding subunit UrtE [Microbacterium sp.]HAM13931.1 urea ABC transporter ATP-binding subunit UrtE [Microbacterium sp.]HBS08250.1 urea ABC transporter ATP-binding subunit UrtE [Microbacterium sp.]HBU43926.1 urea ABC transporter ATP-binding subunit UrtE [Microbacterium sp.]|tara:strand:- start:4620 stop:5300 length:681 start_codon:yes stop_codon:yes gene_type:complete
MLEITGVTAGYGRTKVLHDVTIQIPTGSAVSVMGHNGAGKTTLLRVATGLIPVMSGQVRIDGEDVTKMPPSKRVQRGLGYVPQGQQSFPQMTTLENLQLVAKRSSDIDEVFDLFPVLKQLLGRRAGLLSGGQRQQLAIARTLLTKPRLLVLDEPTEGIQPNIVADIERVIIDLTRRGDLSVLLVEQHVGFALRSTSTYYVLQSGRITMSGEGGASAIDDVRAAMAI